MKRGLDNSLTHLGQIDLLQLHKPSIRFLQSDDFPAIADYARANNITRIGISFSDVPTADYALENNKFASFQFPFNADNTSYGQVIAALQADKADTLTIINRPFSTGKKIEEGFVFVKNYLADGIVLTGTTS